jgi:hypothetical protein
METYRVPYRAAHWRWRASSGYRLAVVCTVALATTIALVTTPSAVGAAGATPRQTSDLTSIAQALESNDALPRPAWWKGGCDAGNNPGSYRLAAVFDGLQACGPGSDQSGKDYLVNFFPGAWGEYEWECVEISMRWMYMAWGVDPYGANGNDVVKNYPNGQAGYPTLTVVKNGTKGEAPQPGDVLSIDDADEFGHTEVVTSSGVNRSGNGTVTAITENEGAQSNGWVTLTVTHWVVSDGSTQDTVLAWLHNRGWWLEEPVLWYLTTGGTLRIQDSDALDGTFRTVATGITRAEVVGGDGYGPSPIVVALTRTGELEGGYYLPGLAHQSLLPLAENVKSFAVSAAAGSGGHPVLAWLTTAGAFEVSAGGLDAPPVEVATGAAAIDLAPNSGPNYPVIGFISTQGTFYDRWGPGALSATSRWSRVASDVTSIALAGSSLARADAIESFTHHGRLWARQGMTGPFTEEATNVSQIATAAIGSQAEPLLAYVSGGSLEVATGPVAAKAFTVQATDVTAVSVAAAMSDAGFPIVGAIVGGAFEVEDGLMNRAFTKEASGVASAGVTALTVS